MPPGPTWLQIWLEAGREGRIFTYANPLGLPLASGDLVRLKLRGRRHVGLVVEGLERLPPELDPDRLQPVEGLHQSAAVDPHWRALLSEVAADCHTSLFKTLKTALPPGWLGQRPERQGGPARNRWLVELTPGADATGPSSSALTPRQQSLLELLEQRGGRAWLSTLTTAERFSRSVVEGLERQGQLRRRAVAAGSAEFMTLQAAGVAAVDGTAGTLEPPQAPSAAQRQALERLAATPPGGALLLWGVTGSGKTEVYLQACALALAEGQSALVLTPEIGLVPQLLDRFKARFASSIVEYHSGLSEAQRIASWRRCLEADRAQPVVVVGTRSAVFLPLRDLALIVLDEEHDSSYKQDAPMPCYHARDVARHRARRSGARLLLGSATPSLETWLACQQSGPGATALVRLPERIGQRPLPPVRVVDMRQELAEGHRRLISRPLMERLERLREQGEQAVVLVPRRGYSSFLSCRSCGEVVQCPHCDVALTVHRSVRSGDWLRCHWCDHRQDIEPRCGACGSTAFKPFGAGTQRVMEQLSNELEDLRVLRFDRDTTRGQGGHRRLLEQFAAGEADVLVGTQMLAKGMDLPAVTLAAVLAADGLLHRPDLRSSEQSLQLLLQLAGRAGRGERAGEVLVQTYCPDHAVIRHLVDGRYERFLEQELEIRRQAGLVPFSRAALLRLVGVSASATATAATTLAERIAPQVLSAGWVMVGPAPAPITRVAGRSRWQLLLHGPSGSPLPLPPEAELRQGLPKGVGLAIDPDPLEL
ncbi:primosomal protein N' [Cyanobium sp. ATX 6F1]|uniref:replication restart helicase PriA n=1 Tax=Cyanobium sp. ATX 6F1 TaxID=2823702 RepID=UPI0020CE0AED|nr:primosomal protein N' [Cyanobium sp. ATX 6F1]